MLTPQSKILFFGDLAPKHLSGTSIAAMINLDILKEKYQVIHIEEDDNWQLHSKKNLSKMTKNFKHAYYVFQTCKEEKPNVFYSHLPSSTFGILKMIFINLAVILSCSSKIVLHLHRGDYYLNFQKIISFSLANSLS